MLKQPSGLQVDVFVNGKRVESKKASAPFLGENHPAVFESIKSYGGKLFRLEEHLDRLFESAKTIGLKMPKTRSALAHEVTHSVLGHAGKDRFVRLMVDHESSYIFISERKRSPKTYENGVDVKTAVTKRNLVHASPPEAKTNAFFNSVLATLDVSEGEAFEAIFLDADGGVVEASIWNIFGVKDKTLLTPGVGILHGVTRQFVIKCAQLEDLPVSETILSRHDIWNCDEAFLTNTSGEIVPIRSLDGRKIGLKVPGPVTLRLIKQFRSQVRKELKVRR